jgi:hypothetical protein
MTELILLPAPRTIHLTGENVTLADKAFVVIGSPDLWFEGKTVKQALADYAGIQWQIVAGADEPHGGVILRIDSSLPYTESYELHISDGKITIHGADSAGVFYGVCTLRQLLQQYGKTLPTLTISDWPDFSARGVMLDISRDKVPTLQTVRDLVDRLASWKINQVQLYMEHTFAYRNHPEVWAEASPFTGEEILELDAFCRQRHVELVPNQNSLGHTERWLKHESYRHLAESPEGFEAPWGGHRAASTLNPLDPGSIELMTSLYDELLPHFSSSRLNIGGDEPWELGKGKSKSEVEKRGGRVYLDYILKLYAEVTKRNHQMQFWADIIVNYPELVPELPKDLTAMLWGYEGGEQAEHEWKRQAQLVANSGVPFYVCPGTSSWNTIAGRTDNTIDNIRIAAETGLEYGAIGLLNTDWGDNGHWQTLPISYPGFAYGAGVSWCLEANKTLDLAKALDCYAFEDKTGVIGKLACDLGNIYKLIGPPHINGQILFYTLQLSREAMRQATARYEAWGEGQADTSPPTLQKAIQRIDEILHPIENADMQREDAALITDEFLQAADLLRHSAQRLLLVQGQGIRTEAELLADLRQLIERQRKLWLARNRPGGLQDSLHQFDVLLNEYEGK